MKSYLWIFLLVLFAASAFAEEYNFPLSCSALSSGLCPYATFKSITTINQTVLRINTTSDIFLHNGYVNSTQELLNLFYPLIDNPSGFLTTETAFNSWYNGGNPTVTTLNGYTPSNWLTSSSLASYLQNSTISNPQDFTVNNLNFTGDLFSHDKTFYFNTTSNNVYMGGNLNVTGNITVNYLGINNIGNNGCYPSCGQFCRNNTAIYLNTTVC